MTRLATLAVGGTITAADTNATRAMVNKTMQLMTPTSVSTGSIGTYGAVTFSAASSISLNGCFTSEFDWYNVEYDITSSGSAIVGVKLRLAGTDAVTNYYDVYTRGRATTTTTATDTGVTSWDLNVTAVTGYHFGSIRLFNPDLTTPTRGIVTNATSANPMTTSDGAIHVRALLHSASTGYDGITFAPDTGNISGTIRVYGII